MPIRVNLKEVFPADSQEITVDKINFNFNKLLELGVGEQGLRGFSGIQGPAGPVGEQGPDGIRGASWFVNSGNPTITDDPNDPDDLLIGDFYLDSNALSVWQWNGTSWSLLFNIGTIVNNYLAASPSPFSRGLGIGTPKDDRFIVFNKRADSGADVSLGGITPNTADNDILFLNNFNEDTIEAALAPTGFIYGPAETPAGSQTDTMDYFNSLLSVYLDHTSSPIGRHHAEFGILYDSSGDPKLTTVSENFKMRYLRETSSTYSDHYNVALFSLDTPDAAPLLNRDFNSLFRFDFPKYENALSVNERISMYIGSKFGMDELTGTAGDNTVDGISFYATNPSTYHASIGLAKEFQIPDFPAETGYVTNVSSLTYFMLDGVQQIKAVYANSNLYQAQGNIIQLGTGDPRTKHQEIPTRTPTNAHIFAGIVVEGNSIYTVNGAETVGVNLSGDFGYINRYSIENPNRQINDSSYKNNGLVEFVTFAAPPSCFTLIPDGYVPLSNVADAAVSGENLFIVNNQTPLISVNATVPSGLNSSRYRRTYFQIANLDNNILLSGNYTHIPQRIGRIGYQVKPGSESYTLDDPEELYCAWRVKLQGDVAIVANNGLHQPGADWNNVAGEDSSYTGVDGYYVAGLTAIDASIPSEPRIIEFCEVPLDSSGYSSSTTVNEIYAAILDFDIVSDRAYTLTWRQGLNPNTGRGGTTGTLPWSLHVDVFDLSNLSEPTSARGSRINWLGRSATAVDSATVNYNGSSTDIPYKTTFGALAATEKYVYVGYEDSVKVFSAIADGGASIAYFNDPACLNCDCQSEFSELASNTINNLGSGAIIYDLKILGNSLFVLYTDLDDNNSYISKYDVSGGLTGTPGFTEIWNKQLSNPAYRFVISGKHIYASSNSPTSSDTSTTGGLIAIDFDGIYTSGAHIESLRADEANITNDLIVGGGVSVNSVLQVGNDARVAGNLGVTGNIQGNLTHIKVSQDAYIGAAYLPAGYDALAAPYKQIIDPLVATRLVFNAEEYDTLEEFEEAITTLDPSAITPAGHSIFTVKNNGFYQFKLSFNWTYSTDAYGATGWDTRYILTTADVTPADPNDSPYSIILFREGIDGDVGSGASDIGDGVIFTSAGGSATTKLKEGDQVEFSCYQYLLTGGSATPIELIVYDLDLYIDRLI